MGEKMGITSTEEFQKSMEELQKYFNQITVDSAQECIDEIKGKNCDNEEEAMQKITEYMKNHSESGEYEYLVRGATLVCSNGSHKRKLNLPMCHGVYIGEHPLLHEEECLSEGEVELSQCNLSFFGVCNPSNSIPPETEIKTYKTTKYNSKDGKEDEVTGNKCKPEIIGCWRDTYSATRIVDNGKKDSADRKKADEGKILPTGLNTITTGSFLVCKYGGLIVPINSGQNESITLNDFYDIKDYIKVKRNYKHDEKAMSEMDKKQ